MTLEKLRLVRDAKPFQAFTIRMADGRSFQVPHRDFLAVPPAGRAAHIAFVYNENGAANILDVMLMTELDWTAGQTASGENAG